MMYKKWQNLTTFRIWPFLAKLSHRPNFLFDTSKEDIKRYNILKNEKNLWKGRSLNFTSNWKINDHISLPIFIFNGFRHYK